MGFHAFVNEDALGRARHELIVLQLIDHGEVVGHRVCQRAQRGVQRLVQRGWIRRQRSELADVRGVVEHPVHPAGPYT
jgi:hypothetical protein